MYNLGVKIEWRQVPDFPEYEVSSDGQLRSCRKHRLRLLRRRWVSRSGHISVYLKDDYRSHAFKIHRLMLLAFVGPCPPGQECRHLDGNPKNSCLDNLAWGTKSENALDRVRHGRQVDNRGQRHGMSKLTEEEAREIKKAYHQGNESNEKIGWRYRVSASVVSRIGTGVRWSHLP